MQCLGGSLDIDFSKNLVEFASDALHIVIFENFVKLGSPTLSELKVTPSFYFPFKIPDDPTATSTNIAKYILDTNRSKDTKI